MSLPADRFGPFSCFPLPPRPQFSFFAPTLLLYLPWDSIFLASLSIFLINKSIAARDREKEEEEEKEMAAAKGDKERKKRRLSLSLLPPPNKASDKDGTRKREREKP